MKWYEDLYVGDSIEGKVNRIKWKINHHAGTVSIYVIALHPTGRICWILYRRGN